MYEFDKIEKEIEKYLGFQKNINNNFDANLFIKIANEVESETKNVTIEHIKKNLNYYFGIHLDDKDDIELKKELESVFKPYMKIDEVVEKELQEIQNYLGYLEYYEETIIQELKTYNKILYRIFKNAKIKSLSANLKYIRLLKSQLNEALKRRLRWKMDMVIGDFYMILTFFASLAKYNEVTPNIHIKMFLVAKLTSFIHYLKETLYAYNSLEERKILNQHMIAEFDKILKKI